MDGAATDAQDLKEGLMILADEGSDSQAQEAGLLDCISQDNGENLAPLEAKDARMSNGGSETETENGDNNYGPAPVTGQNRTTFPEENHP